VVADVSMNCTAFIFKDTQVKNCFTLKKKEGQYNPLKEWELLAQRYNTAYQKTYLQQHLM